MTDRAEWSNWYKRAIWHKGLRPAQLAKQPLCVMCKRQGHIRAASVVDHVKPHRGDWSLFSDPDNLQSLCAHHHNSRKQAAERRGYETTIGPDGWPIDPAHPVNSGQTIRRNPYSIPRGILPSAIPVEIICGPPASGKTTYAHANSKPGDIIIDLDECKVAVGGKAWDADGIITRKAFKRRDRLLYSLHSRTKGKAWFIVTASAADERREWKQALGPKASITIIATSEQVCIERIDANPERSAAAYRMKRAVKAWWQENPGAGAQGRGGSNL